MSTHLTPANRSLRRAVRGGPSVPPVRAHLTPADRTLLHRLRALPGGDVLAEEVRDLMVARDEDECQRADCQQIAATASDVYCAITGGLLSYPTYDARTILTHYEDDVQKIIDEEMTPLKASVAEWRALAEYAMHLAMYGERAPGGGETWREFERRLRALAGAVSEPTP